MKVLVVYPKFFVYGGAEIVVVRLCNYLSRRGIPNALMTTALLPEIEKDLADTEIILLKHEVLSGQNQINALSSLIEVIKDGIASHEQRFDIVNIHNFPAELAIESAVKPVVWLCNEPELFLLVNLPEIKSLPWKWRRYYHKLLNYERKNLKRIIDVAVVSDESNAGRFRKLFGFDPGIINYGIDYEFFSKRIEVSPELKKKYANRFIILHVGMIAPLKNQIESLKAIAGLKDSIPDVLLLIVGGSFEKNYKKICDAFIRNNCLGKYVEYTGHVNREKLRELQNMAACMLHPIKDQGGWLSPFEMLSAGKPIIVPPEMNASYIIKRENIGVVTGSFSEAVLDIYQNPEKYMEMADRGGAFVKDQLSWDSFCCGMLEQFENAVKKQHR